MTVKEFLAKRLSKENEMFKVLLEKDGTVLLAPCSNSSGDKFVSIIELDLELSQIISIDLEKVLADDVTELTICSLYNSSMPKQYRQVDFN